MNKMRIKRGGIFVENKYSTEENKELNVELKKLQTRAKKLILSDYYDHITLSDIQYSILKQITNSESHYDISPYLWNTGMMKQTLDVIADKLNKHVDKNSSHYKNGGI